jgi:hypothetical protein
MLHLQNLLDLHEAWCWYSALKVAKQIFIWSVSVKYEIKSELIKLTLLKYQ